MLIGCLFIDGTAALMLDVVIETALTMVAVVLPLTGIYKNNDKWFGYVLKRKPE